jgi:hypothetical protein
VQEAPPAPEEDAHPLLAAGWQPGVLFDAPGAAYAWNDPHTKQVGSLQLVGQPRTIRTRERLVLISHPCDITSSDEERVEALICKRHDPDKEQGWLTNVQRNSARYFVVDPQAAYVAVASYRVQISKTALPSLTPDPPVMDEDRLLRFTDWLARRYDRPTVPDRIYNVFHRPIYDTLRLLDGEPTMAAFTGAVHDIRVKSPQRMQPPYDMGLLILLRPPGLSEAGANALDNVRARLEGALQSEQIVLPLPIDLWPLDEVPYRLILRTHPLMIEYLSYEGDELVGAQPTRLMEQLGSMP